jgi:hypothetical protein
MEEHAEGIDTIGTSVNGARAQSLLERAEQKRQERESSLFLDIPSWDGDLIGEYQIVPQQELNKVAERVARRVRSGDRDSAKGDIDLIVMANVGLYVRDPESGDRVPIEDEAGIVGFDRIAMVLGKEELIKSNADAVRYLTAERNDKNGTWIDNVVAIGIHAQSISRWMRDPSKRTIDLEELLGEL